MAQKTKPLNNVGDFKIRPKKIIATIPDNENIVGGDAPRVKNPKFEQEIKKLYKSFKNRKK